MVRRTLGWMDWAGWWAYGPETELAVENKHKVVTTVIHYLLHLTDWSINPTLLVLFIAG